MRILLTNDDGIEAEGLRHLVNFAQTLGEVCVCAPKNQQSGKSMSIQIHDAYEVKKMDIFGDIETYSIDSTPADCVRVAVLGMKKQFDLVISGINCGPNLGGDIHYSGTVAGALEGAKSGIKSIAVSAAFQAFDNAVKNIGRVFDEIQSRKMFSFADVLNVNFPKCGDEILITKMGPAIYSDEFEFLEDGRINPGLICLYKGTTDREIDTDAVMTGHISITPLCCDMTDFSAYEAIRKSIRKTVK